MNKGKRLLAVLLAMVMMLSTMSAAMIAFASEVNAKDAYDKISGELSKYLPEDFDKEKAEADLNDLANQISKGAESLLGQNAATETETEAAEGEELPANVVKFMGVMDSIKEPYTDALAQKAFNSYYRDLGNSEDLKATPKEYIEKFKDIYNWYIDAKMNKAPYQLNGFQKAEAYYPAMTDKATTEKFLNDMNPVISEKLADMLVPGTKSLEEALVKGVYTNYTVTMVDATIYKLIAGLDLGSAASMVGSVLWTLPTHVAETWDAEGEVAKQLNAITGGEFDKNGNFTPADENSLAYQKYVAACADVDKAYDEAMAQYKKDLADWESIANNPEPKPVEPTKAAYPNPVNAYWDAALEQGINWGFQDGDREGFINALAHSLDRFGKVISLLLTPAEKDNPMQGAEKLKYQYGIYDDLATILETLGAKNFATHAEFQEYIRTNQTVSTKDDTTELAMRVILTSLFNFVDQIVAAPATELLSVLSKVAYLVDHGDLTTMVNNLVDRNKTVIWTFIFRTLTIGGVKLYPFDLSASGVFNLLEAIADPAVSSGAETVNGTLVLELPVSDTATVQVNLTKSSFEQLISNLAHTNSVRRAIPSTTSRMQYYIPEIVADPADAFLALFNWAYTFLGTDVLAYTLANVSNDPATTVALQVAVQALQTLPPELAFTALVTALDPNRPDIELPPLPGKPEDPEDPENPYPNLPSIGDIIDRILGIFGLGGGDNGGNGDNGDNGDIGGDDVDDPTIPDTAARSAGTAVASLAALAVIGAGVTVVAKRKHEED